MNSTRTSRIANRAVTIAAACAFVSIATSAVAQDEPAVNDGTETISGALPEGALVDVVAAERGDITACHDAALERNSDLHGRMIATWTVTADGTAINAEIAETSLDDADLQDCVVTEIATWEFPPPAGGAVDVRYPFLFRNPDPTIAATDMAPMVVIADVAAEVAAEEAATDVAGEVAAEVVATDVAGEVAGAVVAETGEIAVGDVAVTDAAVGAEVAEVTVEAEVQTSDVPVVDDAEVEATNEMGADAATTVVVATGTAVAADAVVDAVTEDAEAANAELIAQQQQAQEATEEAELRLQQAEDAADAAEQQQEAAEDAAADALRQQEQAEDAAEDAADDLARQQERAERDAQREQERAERDAQREQDRAEDAAEDAADQLAQQQEEAEEAAEEAIEDAERRQAEAEEEAAEAERRRDEAEEEAREAAEEMAREAAEEEAADAEAETVNVTMPTYAVAQDLSDWSNTFSHPDLDAEGRAVARCIPTDFGRRERWTVYVPVSLNITSDGTVENATYLGEDEDGTIQECVAAALDDTELDGINEARRIDSYTFYDTNHRDLQVQRRGEIAAVATLGTLSLGTAIFMLHQASEDRDAAAAASLQSETDYLNNRADEQRSIGQGLVVLTTVSYFAATMLYISHRGIERNENPGIAIMPMFNGRAATIQVGGSF